MVAVNFTVNIVDADVPRVQAAARATFGADLTDAEIIEVLRLEIVARLTNMVRVHEIVSAKAVADALDPTVGIT